MCRCTARGQSHGIRRFSGTVDAAVGPDDAAARRSRGSLDAAVASYDSAARPRFAFTVRIYMCMFNASLIF